MIGPVCAQCGGLVLTGKVYRDLIGGRLCEDCGRPGRNDSRLAPVRSWLKRFLEAQPQGTSVPQRVILEKATAAGMTITSRDLRKVREQLLRHAVLIAPGTRGFRLVVSEADLAQAMAYWRKKALPMLRERSLLRRLYWYRRGEQPRGPADPRPAPGVGAVEMFPAAPVRRHANEATT